VKCDLLTGQERTPVAGAKHVSCTVEMADVHRVRDIAVVDEAHLMVGPPPG
jgi:ATP-dependent RNA helicase SUPV3L1/SUV3